MLPFRIAAPSRAGFLPSQPQCNCLREAFRHSNLSSIFPVLTTIRNATHQAQGRANKAKQGPGKRLGAKKTGGQYVIPGNIIFRQRGTQWYPGENVDMGRDHTIYATQTGYVKYYKDPLRHPKRQYIGVVFDRDQPLPRPPGAARRRRLGMLAVKMGDQPDAATKTFMSNATVGGAMPTMMKEGTGIQTKPGTVVQQVSQRRFAQKGNKPNYMYLEKNWEIGRAAEWAGIRVHKRPGNKFVRSFFRRRNELLRRKGILKPKANPDMKPMGTAVKEGKKGQRKRKSRTR